MAYNIFSKKSKAKEEYYRQREEQQLRKKYHGNLPYGQIVKEGFRYGVNVEGKIHRKGDIINYDNELAQITKVTKKGVYIQRYTSNKSGLFEQTTKKPTFIPEKEYVKKASPNYDREVFTGNFY